jgi:hypothetical protein
MGPLPTGYSSMAEQLSSDSRSSTSRSTAFAGGRAAQEKARVAAVRIDGSGLPSLGLGSREMTGGGLCH